MRERESQRQRVVEKERERMARTSDEKETERMVQKERERGMRKRRENCAERERKREKETESRNREGNLREKETETELVLTSAHPNRWRPRMRFASQASAARWTRTMPTQPVLTL